MDRALGYVRVSRVGARQGDSFLSPELQRESIERICQREALELLEVVEELDRSGGDASRPLWNRCIERIERGEAQALVVWNLSRFARSIVDAKRALDRIEGAGGRLLSEEGAEGISRDILLLMAEHERLRHADSFRRADASAAERGIHVASRVPVGYLVDPKTRRLVPDPEMAPVVRGLFERRAKGWGWRRLAQWHVEQGGSPRTGPRAVAWIVQNRAYRGEARGGGVTNRAAHPPLVDALLFDRANAVSGRAPSHDGSLSSQLLLLGLVRCVGCGRGMSTGRSSATYGGIRRKVASYTCQNVHCGARASVRGLDLDPFVVRALFAALRLVGTTGIRAPAADPGEVEEARRALEAAEYDRKLLVENRELRRLLTAEEYNTELVALGEAVSEARLALALAEQEAPGPPEDVTGLWETWTDETRREFLCEVVERVDVESAKRRPVPVQDRARVLFRGLEYPDYILERTEADVEDRRRRLEAFRQRVRPQQRGTNASSSRRVKSEGDGD